ncbi:hypothetical protein ACQR1Q_30470, partial [Bradyrhizobium oligotrophicum]|uniref:hypothetical protein n=1 Tax=Bradyrhizobium oligotrophicum TaxID=44255 RepID=UPI003EB722BA
VSVFSPWRDGIKHVGDRPSFPVVDVAQRIEECIAGSNTRASGIFGELSSMKRPAVDGSISFAKSYIELVHGRCLGK